MSGGKRWYSRISEHFPNLDRDERLHLVHRLEQGAQANIDFIVMMILSTSLASLGLLADSTAVVIGAMLVAPLMGPLIAAGYSLVQGNLTLFRSSMTVTGVGLAIGFAASLIFGALYIGFEPTLEIEARGKPDLLDLGIAAFSGMTAAYSTGRSNVMTTLAGVAIAAALVPPLAVIGIALTHGRAAIAGNAAILLITNIVAIILGAGFVFRLLNVHVSRHGARSPEWVRRISMLMALVIILLSAPLLIKLIEERRTGQDRPLLYPVATEVRESINEYISNWPGVEVMALGRSSVEPQAGITVILMSQKLLPPEFDAGIISAVHKIRSDQPMVHILPVLAARQSAPASQDNGN